LEAAGLSKKTVKNHVDNIDFFAEYLVYYEPCKLDEADASDVYGFLSDWFPRKAMWASPNSTRSNMASFRKFFKFLVETDRTDEDTEAEVREDLKVSKDEFLDAVDFGY
jgi:site-specific recombinase XerD